MEETTAYHEAGHAVMAIGVGARVLSLSVAPDWDDGPQRYGDATVAWPQRRWPEKELIEKQILVALAGPAVETLYEGEPLHPGFVPEWAQDWRQAWELAANLAPEPALRTHYLEQVTIQLKAFFDEDGHWAAVAAVADELLAHERIEEEELTEIVAMWLAR